MKIIFKTESLDYYNLALERIKSDLCARGNLDELIKLHVSEGKNETGKYEFIVEILKESKMLLLFTALKKDLFKADIKDDIFIHISVDEDVVNKSVVAEMLYDQLVGLEDFVESSIFLNFDVNEFINVGFFKESEYLPMPVFMKYYDSPYTSYDYYFKSKSEEDSK